MALAKQTAGLGAQCMQLGFSAAYSDAGKSVMQQTDKYSSASQFFRYYCSAGGPLGVLMFFRIAFRYGNTVLNGGGLWYWSADVIHQASKMELQA